MKRFLAAFLMLWFMFLPLVAAYGQDDLVSSDMDALLERMPFLAVIVVLILLIWSVVLYVLYSILPFVVFGTKSKLDEVNRNLEKLTEEVVHLRAEAGRVPPPDQATS